MVLTKFDSWLTMANMLSVFNNLTKAKADSGKEVEIDPDAYIDGIIMQVQDFYIATCSNLHAYRLSTPEPLLHLDGFEALDSVYLGESWKTDLRI